MISGSSLPRSGALLVSVKCADEAAAALAGGANIIDAKDPISGALGVVKPDVFTEICATVRGRVPVTAALGDAENAERAAQLAAEYAGRGARVVKVGFAGVADPRRVEAILAATVHACASGDTETGVVAVAYADAMRVDSIDPRSLVDAAARSGVMGVLVDTADKDGPGLTAMWTPEELAMWIAAVRDNGLVAAVAGRLAARDLMITRDAGADIIGVRGAACVGGRMGCVSVDRVRELRAQLDTGSATRRFTSYVDSASHV